MRESFVNSLLILAQFSEPNILTRIRHVHRSGSPAACRIGLRRVGPRFFLNYGESDCFEKILYFLFLSAGIRHALFCFEWAWSGLLFLGQKFGGSGHVTVNGPVDGNF